MPPEIGRALDRIGNVAAMLGGDARYGDGPATVMDPASFTGLLAFRPEDTVCIGHAHARVDAVMDWLIDADTHACLPFVTDDCRLGKIPAKSLARTMPGAKLAPKHAAVLRARVDLVDAERSLEAATRHETAALLAIAA